MKKMISRRNFLAAAGVSAAALGLAACGGSAPARLLPAALLPPLLLPLTRSRGRIYYLNLSPNR